MRAVLRAVAYAVLLGVLLFFVRDNYELYLQFQEVKAESASLSEEYNEALRKLEESKPEYSNNSEIASTIVKLNACHLLNCYLHLSGEAEPVEISNLSEIGGYAGVEYIEYVIMIDSKKAIQALRETNIPVTGVSVTEDLIILSVPSLEN